MTTPALKFHPADDTALAEHREELREALKQLDVKIADVEEAKQHLIRRKSHLLAELIGVNKHLKIVEPI